jgi:hypothetical protein
MEEYNRELCEKTQGNEPCANLQCDKIHILQRRRDFDEFVKDVNFCIFGNKCHYKPCTHYHITLSG